MIRHGFAKCANCHTDPMGGETLTGFGRVVSDTMLSTRWDGSTDPTKRAELFFGVEEPRWLRLGGSVRIMDVDYAFPKDKLAGKFQSFPMQADVYGQFQVDRFRVGGSLGASEVPAGSLHAKAAQVTSRNGPDELNLISRTHWIGYDVTDNVLIRAGRLNLPFGMRIPEHTMWVRDATRTDRESDQQHGVAISYSGDSFRGEIMGVLGNYQISPDKFRERGYSAYGEYIFSTQVALGVSSLITHAGDDRILQDGKPITRQAHGVTARLVPASPFAILAEADVLFTSGLDPGYVGMVQGDYEFARGFHAMLTGEILDRGGSGNTKSPGAGQPEFGGWVSFGWFFFTHFDMRMDLVVRQNDPVTFLSQVHWYF
jgi:hypothetical protein